MRNAIIAMSILVASVSAAAAQTHQLPRPPSTAPSAQNVFADANQIARILQNEGYVAKIDKDQEGDPRITSSSQKAKWTVYFYNCSQHLNCQSIQFRSSFTTQGRISLDQVNIWNNKQRYANAFLDKDNDVALKMDVQLGEGISEEVFKRNLGVWDSQLGGFLTHIGW